MDELRQSISEILVKWHMPTRQVAINEIMALIDSYSREVGIAELEKEQTLHLSDLSRAAGLLDGLGHPDAYLEERRAELLKALGGKSNE